MHDLLIGISQNCFLDFGVMKMYVPLRLEMKKIEQPSFFFFLLSHFFVRLWHKVYPTFSR